MRNSAMGAISQEQIEKIKASNDIVEVIGSYLKLTKRGRNYLALCPFHSEDTPSFTVSREKQFYHCFGCGQGGNVISFIMNHDKMGFVEAIKYLAERAGITIEETASAAGVSSELKDQIYRANKIALEYFRKCLTQPTGKVAADYLNKRQISTSVCKEFNLGFAPDDRQGLVRFAKEKGLDAKVLKSAGLATQTSSGYIDFFRNRLMFPFLNLSGRVVAFGGRTLSEDEPAKYINTPETPIYHKGSILFGLNLTKENIRQEKQAIIVEGYMDLISLYGEGIKNVVCSSGTAFTSNQASLLSRFTDEAVTLFDSDSAGIKAAERSVGQLLSKGVEVLICLLPEGDDPDSFVKRNDITELRAYLEKAESYPVFKRHILKKAFRQLSMREQERLLEELSDIIQQISDPLRRRLFTDQVERVFDFPVSVYQRDFRRAQSSTPVLAEIRNRATLEKEFLMLLSENRNYIPRVSESIESDCFSDPGCRLVYDRILTEYKEKSGL
ncbi:MAG: DNA primase, partial [candidate division Zixibacteria bacterium]|nr:DNA primase [candidate division Zixibacteria bacterium]